MNYNAYAFVTLSNFRKEKNYRRFHVKSPPTLDIFLTEKGGMGGWGLGAPWHVEDHFV